MAELVDAADSKSVFERSGSSSLPRGTKIRKNRPYGRFFFGRRLAIGRDATGARIATPDASQGAPRVDPIRYLPQGQSEPGASSMLPSPQKVPGTAGEQGPAPHCFAHHAILADSPAIDPGKQIRCHCHVTLLVNAHHRQGKYVPPRQL